MALQITYVDDEISLCEIFVELFSNSEVQISTYSNTHQAFEAIKNNPPDLLFLDYRMPDTTGDELALSLQNPPPTFLISGDLSVTTKYPFVRTFSKPFDVAAIEAVIHEQLNLKKCA